MPPKKSVVLDQRSDASDLTQRNMNALSKDDQESIGNEESQHSQGDDEYVEVDLLPIQTNFHCPICLRIIRKTRTVMECMHRFCKECIEKAMRTGKNECPACRAHCSSRRSLRDDPNFDSLIAAIYTNIDKYEEKELAKDDEFKKSIKEMQEHFEKTLRRQEAAAGKKRSAPRRRRPRVTTESSSNLERRRSLGGTSSVQNVTDQEGVTSGGSEGVALQILPPPPQDTAAAATAVTVTVAAAADGRGGGQSQSINIVNISDDEEEPVKLSVMEIPKATNKHIRLGKKREKERQPRR